MKRSIQLVTVCVVCLLLIAGCTAPTNSSQSSPELTADDVTDTSTLTQAHTATLRSQPFTVRSTTTIRDANNTFTATVNRSWHVDPRRPVRALATENTTATGDAPRSYRQAPERISAWRHGNETTVRVESGTEVQIRQVQLLNTSVRLNRALHRQLIYRYSTRQNTTVESFTRDGTQFYRVTADLNDTHVASNASMTLLVNQQGYVQQIKTKQTVAYRSGPRVITERVRFSRTGDTSVEPPPWVEAGV